MASQLGGEMLSLRNGVRCIADSSTSVEDVLVAIAEQVGGENINYGSRMNKAVVVFLKQVVFVTKLVVSGIWVNGAFVQVTPLSAPATKVVVSNVPPFIKNETIERELGRFGKFAGTMKMIPLGCKNANLRHILSFRRQIYMFLNPDSPTLDLTFRVRHGESSFVVFASTDSLRCFECGDVGHKKRSRPHKSGENASSEGQNKQAGEDSDKPNSVIPKVVVGETEEKQRENESVDVPSEMAASRPNTPGGGESGEPEAQPPRVAQIEDPLEGTSEYSKFVLDSDKRKNIQISQCDSGQITERKKGRVEKEVSAEEFIDKTIKGSDSKLHESISVVPVEEQVDITDVECEVGIGSIESVCTQDDEGDISDSSVFSVSMVSQDGDNTLYSLDEINNFLDATKGKTVNVSNFFPDGEKCVRSSTQMMCNASMAELSTQKRFRLKKFCTAVRKLRATSSKSK